MERAEALISERPEPLPASTAGTLPMPSLKEATRSAELSALRQHLWGFSAQRRDDSELWMRTAPTLSSTKNPFSQARLLGPLPGSHHSPRWLPGSSDRGAETSRTPLAPGGTQPAQDDASSASSGPGLERGRLTDVGAERTGGSKRRSPAPARQQPPALRPRPLTCRSVQLEDVAQVLGSVLDVDAGGGHGALSASRRPHSRQRRPGPPALPPPLRPRCAGRKLLPAPRFRERSRAG